eukprot:6813282-Prymnesium_polylepis.1
MRSVTRWRLQAIETAADFRSRASKVQALGTCGLGIRNSSITRANARGERGRAVGAAGRTGAVVMAGKGKKVWVRDPALADTDVFTKGTVISDTPSQARRPDFRRGDWALQSQRCERRVETGCAPPPRSPQITVATASGTSVWNRSDVLDVSCLHAPLATCRCLWDACSATSPTRSP